MELKSPQCPPTVTLRRNPPRKAKTPAILNPTTTHLPPPSTLRSFPLQDILQCETALNPNILNHHHSQNLKVFLRIRPLLITTNAKPIPHARSRSKASPKHNNKNEVCLFVNGSQQVTLSPPQSMQESRRVKTEIYNGFTHVFDTDSLQKQVYEKVMDPLVSDFLRGKSGMLAAVGPTGSGKTHTIFGCPREPGLVPIALTKIFNHKEGDNVSSNLTRSYYISMFEINTEKGKGERIIDLSSDGPDLVLQLSAIKGLKEVMVSNVTEAEAQIAHGMLKRATAMTNSNSQSSRSQCIINIRSAPTRIDEELESLNAVLTIVDLAGAEREKKTGNQGTRLLESNFINNTSMVFGLCLRSLLEHQKNPKKTLQKHFQNSLLTRYLRDYLEGKKRMTLILTVKSGFNDYLDTSFLLRQASPFMKIKYDVIEEPYQKRQINTLSQVVQPKRRKLGDIDVAMISEGKNVRDEPTVLEQELMSAPIQNFQPSKVISPPTPVKLDMNASVRLEEYSVELERMKRNEQIMQKFSKAMWNVLKQYKLKSEESEKKVQILKKSLKEESARYLELEKDFIDRKSCYSTEHATVAFSGLQIKMDTEICVMDLPRFTEHGSYAAYNQSWENSPVGSLDASSSNIKIFLSPLEKFDTTEEQSHDISPQVVFVISPKMEISDIVTDLSLTTKDLDQQNCQKLESLSDKENNAEDIEDLINVEVKDNSSSPVIPDSRPSELVVTSSHSHNLVGDDSYSPTRRSNVPNEVEGFSCSTVLPKEEVGCVTECNITKSEMEHVSPCKSLHVEKPKRRLLPASSILLKEINSLDLEDENAKPKNRAMASLFSYGERLLLVYKTEKKITCIHGNIL
ncbi:hypothetical protein GIB67_008681, partial [Kingdonia uniflora]